MFWRFANSLALQAKLSADLPFPRALQQLLLPLLQQHHHYHVLRPAKQAAESILPTLRETKQLAQWFTLHKIKSNLLINFAQQFFACNKKQQQQKKERRHARQMQAALTWGTGNRHARQRAVLLSLPFLVSAII